MFAINRFSAIAGFSPMTVEKQLNKQKYLIN